MQSMRCLAIGISDAPPLEFLQGAANGARFFGAWARAQNIQTEILTDEETPVGFTEVADAFRRLFAGAPKVSRFLLYFAGHGLARDAAEDLWLLSKWQAEQRAIAVGALRRRLERYGIEQITLIGDACRSLPASAETADLTADAVLGMGRFDPTAPRLDMLLASSSFHAAYMVPGAQPEDDRCIFSGVLEEALSGAREDAFDSRRNSITSVSLAKFLEREVPVRAAQYKVELQPSLATGFWEPDDVYVEVKPVTPPQPKPKPWPSAAAVDAMSAEATASGNRSRGWSTRGGSRVLSFDEASDIGSLPGFTTRGAGLRGGSTSSRGALLAQDRVREATTAQARNQQIQQFVAAYRDEQERRPLPDIATGVRLIGDRARSVELGSSGTAADEADGRWWRVVSATTRGTRARPDVTGPLLLELESGRWAAAAVLPGFVATFTLAKEGVVSLIYRRPYDHADARQTELAVSRMRAGALIGEAALDLAAELRTAKERDPVRGLLAAYLYDGQGDTDSVRRTAYYLAEAGLALPFDIAILGRLKIRKNRGRYVATVPEVSERRPLSKVEARKPWTFHATRETDALIAGVVPWLRQGWAMLEDEPIPSFPPGLLELRNELLRSPFTTLTNEGGLRLQSILKEM